MKQGFTLLELSIVLVIIGLIIGGITVGADLIRAAELNSVVSDVNKYKVAVNTFKLKYNSLPGDMDNAYSYWGTNCYTSGGSASAEECNGNNDGQLDWNYSSPDDGDGQRAFGHLGLSGIINGSYTIKNNNKLCAPDISSPASSIGGAYYFDFDGRNFIGLGETDTSSPFTNKCYNKLISPQESLILDEKIDDGNALSGNLIGKNGANGGDCISVSDYDLSKDSAECYLEFAL